MSRTDHRFARRAGFILPLALLMIQSIPAAPRQAAQAAQPAQGASLDSLFKELGASFDSGGEKALRTWARANAKKLGDDLLSYVDQRAARGGGDKLLKIAEILASEKGYACLEEGENFASTGENAKARALYEKARALFEKARDAGGLGNVYRYQGELDHYMGDNARALLLYDKALPLLEASGALKGQGNVYRGRGDVYLFMGRNPEALAMYEKALSFFEKAQDPDGQGNVRKNMGDMYTALGDFDKAVAMFEKALPFFEKSGNLVGRGNVYLAEGSAFRFTGENEKALAMYEKALPFYEKTGDALGQGNVNWGRGNVYMNMSENEKALVLFEKALPFFEKAQAQVSQGNVYGNLGTLHMSMGDNEKALAMFEKALAFYEKAQAPFGLGNIYLSEGDLFLRTGEIAKAQAHYDKALVYYEKAQEPVGQGNVWANKGEIFALTGEYAKALAMYEKALPFYEKARSPLGQGNVRNSEGGIFLQTGNQAKARALFEQALALFEGAQDPVGQGNVLLSQGDILRQTGESAKAMAAYQKALSFFVAAQDPIGQGNAYLCQGDAALQEGDGPKALAFYEKALPFFESAQDALGQGSATAGQGDARLRTGDYPKALASFEKAEALYGRLGYTEGTARALLGKAGVLGRQGRKDQAAGLYEAGLENLEKVRARTLAPEMKASYMQMVYDDFEEAARFMLDGGYPERGFRIVESMKARLFLDRLAENMASVDKGLDPALKERRDALTGKLSALAKDAEQAGGEKDEARLAELAKERQRVEAEFEKLQMDIRTKNPAYAALSYPTPVSPGDLQRGVLKPGEVLVEYFLSEEKAFAFVVTKARFKAIELPAGRPAIESAVQGYLRWIGNPRYRPEDERGRLAAGAALYVQLLKPLEPDLAKGATIIVVPDGVLAKLPFESLVVSTDSASGRPAYLLEKYPVTYIQSASVLAFLRTQPKAEGGPEAFVGFGDPVYDYEHYKKNEPEKGSAAEPDQGLLEGLHRDRFAGAGGTLDRLEGSGREVTEVGDLFRAGGKAPAGKPDLKLRLEASEDNAKAPAMANYAYILFSCHGLLGNGFQGLVLSQVPGAAEDGFLTLGEIMNSSYRARLVVLSGCQTGQGAEARGEGVTGLTRAVMYAGSPAAVVSLWSVDDEATRDLMVRFFRHMIGGGLDKGEALRRAKLEMLKGEARFQVSENRTVLIGHPFFWAAFVMYGE
jgi:CHAT domain-containing protein/predicted negative regulator of RcsB-dependent stress response